MICTLSTSASSLLRLTLLRNRTNRSEDAYGVRSTDSLCQVFSASTLPLSRRTSVCQLAPPLLETSSDRYSPPSNPLSISQSKRQLGRTVTAQVERTAECERRVVGPPVNLGRMIAIGGPLRRSEPVVLAVFHPAA